MIDHAAELTRAQAELDSRLGKTDILGFARVLGLDPTSKQEPILLSTSRRVLINACRQYGKRLDVETPIPTPVGWTKMGALKVGDIVYNERGRETSIQWVGPIETSDSVRLRFSDGSSIVCDREHLWTTIDRSTRRSLRRNVREIPEDWTRWERHANGRSFRAETRTAGQVIETLRSGVEANHCIPVAGAIQGQHRNELPVDPYVLGVWLGDGTTANATLTKSLRDKEILERVEAAGYPLRKRKAKYSWLIRGGLQRTLRLNGLLGHKHIPAAYLRSSIEQRKELLRGLMDTDGTCGKHSGQCEISFSNQELIEQTQELCHSLGLITRLFEGEARLNGRYISQHWRLKFYSPFPAFHLTRKLERQAVKVDRSNLKRRLRYIVGWEPAGQTPMRCIAVDSPSKLFLAGRQMVPTHNSSLSSILSLHRAYYHPGSLILIVAPSERQSSEMFRKVTTYLNRMPVRPKLLKENEHEVEFENGSRIVALPSSEGTIRGYSAVSLLIIDEAGDVPPDIFAALRPMIARSAGRLILQGTPKGRRGIFFERWERGKDWERHLATWEDCREWLSEEEIAEARIDLGPLFEQEYGGSFLAGGQGLVYAGFDETRNVIERLPETQAPWSYLLGLDFGVINGTAFAVAAWRPYDPNLYIVRCYKRSGMTPTEAADEVNELEREYHFSRMIADTGGLGKGFAVEAQRRWHLPLEAAKKTDKKGYINMMNGDFRRGEIQIVRGPCAQLLEEIVRLSWVDRGDGEKEDPGAANDCLDSALYVWRGGTQYLQRPEAEAKELTVEEEIREKTRAFWERQQRRIQAAQRGHEDVFIATSEDVRGGKDAFDQWELEDKWSSNPRVYQ